MKPTLLRLTAALTIACLGTQAQAAEKLTFITSWKAQAEHGGYYAALANGYYAQCGVDLQLRQGGPGIDGKQLLVGGAVDIFLGGFSDTAFQLVSAGYPARAIMAGFQKNPQILITHEGNGVEKLADMKGHPISISAASRTTFWPFLRAKYGFTDDQIRPYAGMAPWLADKNAIQQSIITSEPFLIRRESGKAPKVFLLAQDGYESYGSIPIASQALIDAKPAAVQCFVQASIKGWTQFFKDPAPAVALMRKDNPDNPDDLVGYTIKTLQSAGIVDSDETRKLGIGSMSDARWKAHAQMLIKLGLLPADFDYQKAFTLQFVNKKAAN